MERDSINAETKLSILEETARIVSTAISSNAISADKVPEFIKTVSAALSETVFTDTKATSVVEKKTPAVPVGRSVFPDYIVCLEDGKKFKSLKRHLSTVFGLTPDEYRAKWKLAANYPMVAPNYAATRSRLAKASGLGTKRAA
ncbi:MucR family transcriptional regulator [Mesorhizobium silamurunense]|uniref:MucR family transcriptional regulator n=1 Tax=Mesorhizobium silamurunense TaxID=499528 RepID=UPI0017831A5A|nr:MucR family transcriptional regulator [Mesorhizobium silamurunense]